MPRPPHTHASITLQVWFISFCTSPKIHLHTHARTHARTHTPHTYQHKPQYQGFYMYTSSFSRRVFIASMTTLLKNSSVDLGMTESLSSRKRAGRTGNTTGQRRHTDCRNTTVQRDTLTAGTPLYRETH